MHAGDLRQQLAVATAEGAEHNERAIQAAALVDGLQTQVSFSECEKKPLVTNSHEGVNSTTVTLKKKKKKKSTCSICELHIQGIAC